MAKIFGELHFNFDFIERFESLEKKLMNIENLIKSKIPVVQDGKEPIPQKAAILLLRTTFPTFKKLISEFRVKPIKRGNRLFYHSNEILRIQNGLKR